MFFDLYLFFLKLKGIFPINCYLKENILLVDLTHTIIGLDTMDCSH